MYLTKVTAIITTYNTEGYIAETINNISKQTLSDIQVIIVDDYSTDSTIQIINEICRNDPRFLVLVNEDNRGAGYSRNRGLQYAHGEYIIFLDDDDIYSLDMLETAYKQASDNNADILVFRSNNLDDDSGIVTETAWTIASDSLPEEKKFNALQMKNNFFRNFIWWAWDKLISHELIIRSGLKFQEIRTTNDLYFVCAIMLQAEEITVCDDILITHRDNRAGSLSNTREISYYCSLEAIKKLDDFLTRHPELYPLRKNYNNYSVEFLSWSLSTLKSWEAYEKFYMLIRSFYQQSPLLSASDFESDYLAEQYQHFISGTPEHMLMALKCRLEQDVRHTHQLNTHNQNQLNKNQKNLDKMITVTEEYKYQLQLLEGQKNEMVQALGQHIEQKSQLEQELQHTEDQKQRFETQTKQYQEELGRLQNSFCGKLILLLSGESKS
ncbi:MULTISPECIES: glycosyltransferase family 2 protein [unclassified Tatumella]|uniref:glycosyltransferase family 2 protein n=1 Tax=unclassified Tatumella TaxID=2649542 RepID=UPI001BAE60FB|nr:MULTISPECIES: glycosyltransferase family 2 protein [unclassified Tatumella]MBS0854776.1 glycosyltransferase [Tatumella sp. JGM16]MBS0894832.1 glycosyltransferase [Tatumella sp. JGM130]MBS0913865.1 glycosyltransferase [Tatumella sp. JGM91]